MGWEVERGVSRPYLKDLVFIQNDPVFMKSGKKLIGIPDIISYFLTSIGAFHDLIIGNMKP